ncbi:hypothetical protein [Prescottella agglutinans]|uniref:Phage tail protein n=1 Tax=Prescottella agglutinans TaxID=1644129 RepID=A0ABT6MEQ5_9NOCA|nr:hypothetical protein [Prescottella agglutinans]MDH6282788.1 hypothetical protein [Prescottella agglutinans]
MPWNEVGQLASKADVTAVQAQVDAKAPKASPTFTGTVTTLGLKVTSGAAAGKVLTSAADGTASWQDAAAGGGTPGVKVTGYPAGNAPTTPTTSNGNVVAIGHNLPAAVADSGTVVGARAQVTQTAGVALGYQSSSLHGWSTALGAGSKTTAANQVMLGSASETVVAPNKLQIGPDGSLSCTLSTRANGSGKTELIAQFATGAAIVIATQP